ncbi:VOC family protein [Bosea sp. (in: a-proteobacteria)]|uniref:VOC family protein n=1 Tax=Bosea sp. (in: a-proteobacteria) TaxID=1871050 RepID=UPI00345CE03F
MIAGARFLHTMLHVADIERSIAFYTDVLGMRVLRRGDMPDEGRRNAFIGYGPEENTTVLELTDYRGRSAYEAGDAFGHIALGMDDVREACRLIAAAGGQVTREPFTIASGKVIAFLADPDGYAIELVQPAPAG